MSDQKSDYNPYNKVNRKITNKDIYRIFSKFNLKSIKINNINIYQQSFVHKSYVKSKVKNYIDKNNLEIQLINRPSNVVDLFNNSNERLEFLGDAIIGSIIVSYIYRRFEEADEGFMTKLKTRLVKTETLGKFAKIVGLDKFLIISDYVENKCNGRVNIRILEDLFEAFMGAMFLDASDGKNYDPQNLKFAPGYSYCESFIINLIEKHVDFEDLILNDENYKDILLRYFQQHFGISPKYIEISNTGPSHQKIFTMGVIDKEGNIIGKGQEKSKKKAEQLASKNALNFLENNNTFQ